MAVYKFIDGRNGTFNIGMLHPSSGILAYYLQLEHPKSYKRVA